MTETIKETLTSKNNGVLIASSEQKQLVKITGTLTSPIQLRGEGTQEPYYYSFIRLKGQAVDLPVIFKVKAVAFKTKGLDNRILEPDLKKGTELELQGNYSGSPKNVRKSFTAYSYQLLNEKQGFVGDQKRIRKKCLGCCDTFTCYQKENYDYCRSCELNGSRYVNRSNKCPECGDGQGIIKFPHQPPRNCKTCYLTQPKEGENLRPHE
ncbi:MAG: hypothetical protein MRERV_83c006 [Mycoplasmataceae bacterium RV_VA103A]|nr:MAG: hypothetical protein MRERV_83c006 [Mycoplasmataceae bacterium RV_VA103A]